MTISEGGHKHAREFGGWGVVFVSIATAGNLIVVSCAPGWTEADWDAAVTAADVDRSAYLDAEQIEPDGTEIYYLTTAAVDASVL
jgi:hypothetical protein